MNLELHLIIDIFLIEEMLGKIYILYSYSSILGMAFLGMVGFLALGFTIMGMIAGGVLGVMLGRYAGRRMKKTFNAN